MATRESSPGSIVCVCTPSPTSAAHIHPSQRARARRSAAPALGVLAVCCCLAGRAAAFFVPPVPKAASWAATTTGVKPLRAAGAFTVPTGGSVDSSGRRGGSLKMISSLFRWRKEGNDDEDVMVNIESPANNVRRISSAIVINRPLEDVWSILTDYDKLADYVPNLTQSKTVARPPGDVKPGVRLFQEGAQKIIGFNFRASLTMDMEEIFEGEDEKLGQRRIKFKLVDSAMFSDFSGEWRLQCYSRMRTNCSDPETGGYRYTYSTKLFYMVTVKPKGPVPVGALEWRIREDVPTNLQAVKRVSEALPWDCDALDGPPRGAPPSTSRPTPWLDDETLEAYLPGSGVGEGDEGGADGGVRRVGEKEAQKGMKIVAGVRAAGAAE